MNAIVSISLGAEFQALEPSPRRFGKSNYKCFTIAVPSKIQPMRKEIPPIGVVMAKNLIEVVE